MSHGTAAGGPSGGRTPEARNPESRDQGERRWTIYVCPFKGCQEVFPPEQNDDCCNKDGHPLSDVEEVEVVPARALEEARERHSKLEAAAKLVEDGWRNERDTIEALTGELEETREALRVVNASLSLFRDELGGSTRDRVEAARYAAREALARAGTGEGDGI